MLRLLAALLLDFLVHVFGLADWKTPRWPRCHRPRRHYPPPAPLVGKYYASADDQKLKMRGSFPIPSSLHHSRLIITGVRSYPLSIVSTRPSQKWCMKWMKWLFCGRGEWTHPGVESGRIDWKLPQPPSTDDGGSTRRGKRETIAIWRAPKRGAERKRRHHHSIMMIISVFL